jgi:hypothetical protein
LRRTWHGCPVLAKRNLREGSASLHLVNRWNLSLLFRPIPDGGFSFSIAPAVLLSPPHLLTLPHRCSHREVQHKHDSRDGEVCHLNCLCSEQGPKKVPNGEPAASSQPAASQPASQSDSKPVRQPASQHSQQPASQQAAGQPASRMIPICSKWCVLCQDD